MPLRSPATSPLLLLAAGGALLAACQCGPRGDALHVTITGPASPRAGCLTLELRRPGGDVLASVPFAREAGETAWDVAVLRQALPSTVELVARDAVGACGDEPMPNGASALAEATFEPARIVEVGLALPGGDADGDGFRAADGGGADCDDAEARRFPGATEACLGGSDLDCDGLVGCEEPSCPASACAGAPARLAFTTPVPAVRVGECSPPVTVRVEDAAGRPSPPATAVSLTLGLDPATRAARYLDAACTQPAGALTLAPGSGEATVHLRAGEPGPLDLVASAEGLAPASQAWRVGPALPTHVAFVAGVSAPTAGACVGGYELELRDGTGLAAGFEDGGALALDSSADAGWRFFADPACQAPVTGLLLDAGVTRVPFAIHGTRAGPVRLVATSPGLDAGAFDLVLAPGPAVTLTITSPVQTLVAPACSAPLTLEARDAFGNLAPLPAGTTVSAPGAALFSGSGCQAALGADAGVPASLSLFGDGEGTVMVLVEAGGLSASQPVTFSLPPPPGGRWRWPLTVTTGPNTPTGGYRGYTLTAAFDLAAAADAGQALADGGDLHVLRWADGGWSELDRELDGVGTGSVRVRWASPVDLPASSTDRRTSLVSGPLDGGAPLAAMDRVYLLSDDFEGPALSKWTVQSGAWARATDRVHGGGGALKYPAEADNTRYLVANPALSEADVFFEAWWNIDNTGDADFAQFVRLQPGTPVKLYETNLEDNAGWNLAWYDNGAWTERAANVSPPTQDTWIRIGYSLVGGTARVWRNGVAVLNPSSSQLYAAPLYGPGNVGFRKWDLGGAGLWIDDVTLRRYTEPEPTVTVGPAVAFPP